MVLTVDRAVSRLMVVSCWAKAGWPRRSCCRSGVHHPVCRYVVDGVRRLGWTLLRMPFGDRFWGDAGRRWAHRCGRVESGRDRAPCWVRWSSGPGLTKVVLTGRLSLADQPWLADRE